MSKKQIFDISTDTTTLVDVPSNELPTIDSDQIAANALADLRRDRNFKLAETDYMAMSDNTMSDAWKTYRQSLRDITNTYQSTEDEGFAFPTKPSE